MTSATSTRALHIIAVAARLAAIYGVGVLLLLTALVFWTGDWVGNLQGVLTLNGYVFGILFAAAFLLLAAARRVGFAVLWLLFIALWVWTLARFEWRPIVFLATFVFWTVMALPFYLIGAIGFPGRPVIRVARWTATVPTVALTLWVLLVLFTLAVTPPAYLFVASSITGSFGQPPSAVLKLAPVVWGTIPFLITLEALVRLWPGAPHDAAPAENV